VLSGKSLFSRLFEFVSDAADGVNKRKKRKKRKKEKKEKRGQDSFSKKTQNPVKQASNLSHGVSY
jgi:hypothetical protein